MAAALLLLGASACGTGAVRPGPGAAEGWRHLAAARPPGPQPGYGGRFVWTGREVLLWGLGGGVAYDPSADRWRRMARAPFTREFHSATWTGSELLVWGGATGQDCVDGCPRADGLAYRPGPR